MHPLLLFILSLTVLASAACDSSQRTPSAPPIPDIDLPPKPEVGSTEEEQGQTDPDVRKDAGPMEDPVSPIAANLIGFVPEWLDGVQARRRQSIETAPIVHGFYQGEKRKIYNLQIKGPNESESDRRAKYPLLGTKETKKQGHIETKGLKIKDFDAQRTYDKKKKKSETVVIVNEFVQVRLSVAPTKKADASVKLLDEIDLVGLSKMR